MTVGTNNDKTGYTVSTNSDKTGYNVSSIDSAVITAAAIATDAIGASEFAQGAADKVWASSSRTITGTVTVGTNNDKTGYTVSANSDKTGYNVSSIDSAVITAAAIATDAIGASEFAQGAADKVWASSARTITGTVTVGTNNDKTAYNVSSIDSAVITAAAIATDAIGASEFAQGAADKVWATTSRTITGTVTVGTNNDKTGYTVSTNSDKTGYNVSSIDANVITASSIATDAIGASEFEQGAADKIWSSSTRTLTGTVTVGTNNDKTGYSLASGSYASVKSVQYGTYTFSAGSTTASATISSVGTSKSILIDLGFTCGRSSPSGGVATLSQEPYLTLASSTSVSATRAIGTSGDETWTGTGSFVVLEFF